MIKSKQTHDLRCQSLSKAKMGTGMWLRMNLSLGELTRAFLAGGRRGVLRDNSSPARDVRVFGKKSFLMGYCSSNSRWVTYRANNYILYQIIYIKLMRASFLTVREGN